jgi:peptidoglycan/LPS O-acetylase OafA/YrhL
MQFYVAYCWLLCFGSRRLLWTVLIALIPLCPLLRLALGAALSANGWAPIDSAFAVYAAPGLHFDSFAMGALLALGQEQGRLRQWARPLAAIGLLALAAYCGLYLAVNGLVRHARGVDIARDVISGILAGEQREAWVYSAIGLAMAGLVALAADRDPWVRPIFGIRMLQQLGLISYGVYLFHQIGLRLVTQGLALSGLDPRADSLAMHGARFLLGGGLAVALAYVSFHWFETPMRRWIAGRQGEPGAHGAPAGRPGLAR